MSSGNIHIHSMTGFANAAAECGSKRINLDIRAVNHRFLDIQIRMPDDLRYLESGIREKISSHIARGKGYVGETPYMKTGSSWWLMGILTLAALILFIFRNKEH